MPEKTGNTGRRAATVRNFVAKNQWQRGGVHEKTTKARRQKAKQKLKKQIRSGSAADFFVSMIHLIHLIFLNFRSCKGARK